MGRTRKGTRDSVTQTTRIHSPSRNSPSTVFHRLFCSQPLWGPGSEPDSPRIHFCPCSPLHFGREVLSHFGRLSDNQLHPERAILERVVIGCRLVTLSFNTRNS